MENVLLKMISDEIEKKYDCKVVSIKLAQLLSLCISCKIQFNEDFLYKPFEDFGRLDTICFSERTVSFYKRVDLFDCVKVNSRLN